MVCLFSSKSLSLNLYSHLEPFRMFLHTRCMYSKRSWITLRVPHSRDTGFLSASVQENNITYNTQLSRPHIMVAIWVLNCFSRGCFLMLEKIIQLCFLLHRCRSLWILWLLFFSLLLAKSFPYAVANYRWSSWHFLVAGVTAPTCTMCAVLLQLCVK